MASNLFNTDPSKLGKDFQTFGFNSDWTGYEGDDISSGIARTVMDNPELLTKLGLSADDIRYIASSASPENEPYGNFRISDAARKAMSGMTISRTGAAGLKDGRSQVLRDAQGNILFTGKPYSYDPAGELKDALIKGLAVAGAGWGIGSMLGLGGAAPTATAAGGTAAGAEAGALASGAEAAGAAGAGAGAGAGAAGASQLTPAALESLVGTSGYGANAAADLFGASVGAGASGAGVSAFDSALAALKNVGLNAVGAVSPSAASSLVSGGDWFSKTFGVLTGGGGATGGSLLGGLFSGSSLLRDLLPVIGAGVQQYNLEKMAEDQRRWQDKKEADTRRRRMPTTGPGMLGKFRVIPGAGNGG